MTAAELIAFLHAVPPDTPVVRMADPCPATWRVVRAEKILVHRIPGGDYGKFRLPRLQHRNNVLAVEVY